MKVYYTATKSNCFLILSVPHKKVCHIKIWKLGHSFQSVIDLSQSSVQVQRLLCISSAFLQYIVDKINIVGVDPSRAGQIQSKRIEIILLLYIPRKIENYTLLANGESNFLHKSRSYFPLSHDVCVVRIQDLSKHWEYYFSLCIKACS